MKKSNILIIGATLIALTWTVIIGWLAASTINNYLERRNLHYARSYTQIMESHKKTFPAPASELFLSAEGTAFLSIMPGKELAVKTDKRVWDISYTDLKNGESMIQFKKLIYYDSPIILTLPAVSLLSLYNFSGVKLSGLNLKEIHIQCKRIYSFTADSCRAGTLTLDFPGIIDQQDIYIMKSNKIDTLMASVQGTGKIRLETAGVFKNQFSLSGSIKLESTSDLMKKVSIQDIPGPGRK